jgi:hypothetical protein
MKTMKYTLCEKDSIFLHLSSLEYAPSKEMIEKLINVVFTKLSYLQTIYLRDESE